MQVALDAVVQENSELLLKVRLIHQELVSERTVLCQTTADKMDLEHQLHVSILHQSDISYYWTNYT